MHAYEEPTGIKYAVVYRTLVREGNNSDVALILLDFILGANSSRDPVGDLLEAIRGMQEAARRRGVCIFSSNARAVTFCREAVLLLAQRREVD